MTIKAIDLWVNVSMGAMADTPFLKKVKEEYFKAGDDFFRNIEADELVALMDDIGVEKVLLSVVPYRPEQRILDFTSSHPGRFFLAAQPQLTRGMKALWALEDLARDYPVVLARVTPFQLDKPPNDPIYYPLYAKCIEMDIPVGINTGLPGPPVPGECQHPMYLDRVCLHFPQLKIIMQHGADPWWDLAIRLMIKYRNLYLMTSAYSPKYLPESLLHYMNTRGKHKIMFASDHPVLGMDRCLEEAKALDLRDGILEKYLFDNANAVLFGERSPRYGEFK
ncbi:MAG: amidohydrolase [Halioglobus sp.]|nr:amidohydrolase [Halioglobus sp.]